VFKAHRLLYHSTLGLRVTKKKKKCLLQGLGFSGSGAGSYLRRIDSCITQIKAQGPSRTCDESKEEEEACFNVSGSRASEEGTIGFKDFCLKVKAIIWS